MASSKNKAASKPSRGDAATPKTPGQFLLKRIAGAHSDTAVAKAIRTIHPNWEGAAKQITRWYEEENPRAPGAFMLGEAMRELGCIWSSGLAGLNLFGHLAEFAAIVGSCDIDILDHLNVLFPMLQTYDDLRYVSAFDVIKEQHPILNGEADDFLLRQISDTLAYGTPVSSNFTEEANRLNCRWVARGVWTLEPRLLDCVRRGFDKWSEQCNGTVGDIKYARTLHFPLNHAYEIGKISLSQHFSREARDYGVRSTIMLWLCDQIALNEGASSEFLLRAATDRGSKQARTIRAMLFCYARIFQTIFHWKYDLSESDIAFVAQLAAERQLLKDHGLDISKVTEKSVSASAESDFLSDDEII